MNDEIEKLLKEINELQKRAGEYCELEERMAIISRIRYLYEEIDCILCEEIRKEDLYFRKTGGEIIRETMDSISVSKNELMSFVNAQKALDNREKLALFIVGEIALKTLKAYNNLGIINDKGYEFFYNNSIYWNNVLGIFDEYITQYHKLPSIKFHQNGSDICITFDIYSNDLKKLIEKTKTYFNESKDYIILKSKEGVVCG